VTFAFSNFKATSFHLGQLKVMIYTTLLILGENCQAKAGIIDAFWWWWRRPWTFSLPLNRANQQLALMLQGLVLPLLDSLVADNASFTGLMV
jgi:hypothetical protein